MRIPGPRTVDSVREWFCVVVPALYVLGRRERVAPLIARGLCLRQAPRRFFEELFFHLSLLLGFPTMLDGLELLQQISPRRRRKRSYEQRRSQKGLTTLSAVYGEQTSKLLSNLHRLHPDLPRLIVNDVYGRIIARAGLSLAEREIINVTVLAIQGLERQLFSHIRGAMRTGVGERSLRSSMLLLQRLTGNQLQRPLEIMSVVVSQRKKS